jgi:hypothetical protein
VAAVEFALDEGFAGGVEGSIHGMGIALAIQRVRSCLRLGVTKRQIQGSLRCAANGEAVRRFGRDDVLLGRNGGVF